MKRISTLWGMLILVLLLSGCDGFLLSKEQRRVNTAIRQAVAKDPSRINAPFEGDQPPLHLAMSYHLPSLFDWLLDHGADPNARGQGGRTALHEAVFYDSPDHRIIQALLKRGARVNGADTRGETPLHVAAFLSHASTAEALLAAGATPNALTESGETPLHCAAVPQPTASPEEAARTIRVLVAGGADPDAHRANGGTPLHMAALVGSVLACRILLEEGAKVDEPGCGGQTALHVAAVFAKPEVAEILLKAGANLNHADDRGRTPLALALHYPAVTTKGSGAGPVDTSAVVEVLKRYRAIDQGAPSDPGHGR